MALEATTYFVMSHYGLGLRDLRGLSPEEFSMMLTWATASEQHKAEQAEEGQAQSQNKMKVGSTSMSRPMPFSDV